MRATLVIALFLVSISSLASANEDLIVVSIATDIENDGYKRFVRSLKAFGYKYEIYGIGEEWRGGEIDKFPGGGQKINILKREIERYKDDSDKIIVFSDAYDSLFDKEPNELLSVFKNLDAKVVFGAEVHCWPDESLIDSYPQVGDNESRFLNSGGIIAYAPEFYKLLTQSEVKDNDDDQLYYTNLFLDNNIRDKLKIKLDTKSQIFINLNGYKNELIIKENGGYLNLKDIVLETSPIVIHGNGAAKTFINALSNYVSKAWSTEKGCLSCNENQISLEKESKSEWPFITLAIFIEKPIPFLKEFFVKIGELNYPKDKIAILVHNNVKYHNNDVAKFFEFAKASNYASIKYISPNEDSQEYEARAESVQECLTNKCDFYFAIDGTAHLDNPDTLKLLIESNRPIIAPIMLRKGTTWSNFWGAITPNGYYHRSADYMDIIEKKKIGIWNMPYICEAVLVNGNALKRLKISFEDSILDADMAFAKSLRGQNAFMYATNMHQFGHLVNPDTFNTTITRPEMYEIFTNPDDWEKRFIHPDFFKTLEPDFKNEMPCPDVYWFPFVTEEFCESLIDMMETYGKWSGGKNDDPRLPGGYENVPTVDIHMNQVGWEKHWLEILRKYIQRMQRKIFIGYVHDPPKALLNFVVRYKPTEMDHLVPHHDASTYTINLALNRPKIDFEGGGVRFVKYDCKVTDLRRGWSFMHPGRLTHFHEGLTVTNGTRYIMVSFIDP